VVEDKLKVGCAADQPQRDMPDSSGSATAGIFATTHWSVVLAAGTDESVLARSALETLCQAYWPPIYVFIRRKGYGPSDAQDLTQGFFAQLLAKDHLRLADKEKGRFRTFLLSMLDYFLAHEWSRAHCQKRGGAYHFVSLDSPDGEALCSSETADHDTPERQFARQWALTVLQQAMNALAGECEASGKGALFREVKGLLSGERDHGCYPEIGERLGMREGAVRVAVHRLRQRYGDLLRNEIAQTVGSEEEVDEEMDHLLQVLSR